MHSRLVFALVLILTCWVQWVILWQFMWRTTPLSRHALLLLTDTVTIPPPPASPPQKPLPPLPTRFRPRFELPEPTPEGLVPPQAEREQCTPHFCMHMCRPRCGQLPRVRNECVDQSCHRTEPWLLYRAEIDYPLVRVQWPELPTCAMRTLLFRSPQVQTDYLPKHGHCPSTRNWGPMGHTDPRETRCGSIEEAWDPGESLIFSERRFVQGEVVVIRNGVWRGKPDQSFGEDRKCAYSSDYHWVRPDPQAQVSLEVDKLFVFMTPSGSFFQHFVDRGWSRLFQIWSLLQADPEIMMLNPGRYAHPIVGQILKRLGIGPERLVSSLPRERGKSHFIRAKEMYFSCVAPHYHPYPYQKAAEILGVDMDVPLDAKDTILYLSRSHGTSKKSRPVVNANAVVGALRHWVQVHGRNETVRIFHHSDFPTLEALMQFMNRRVKVLVGPHGGAFYNQIFTSAQTVMIEFFPFHGGQPQRWTEGTWWPARFGGRRFWMLPTSGAKNAAIRVDPELPPRILDVELRGLSRTQAGLDNMARCGIKVL